MASKKPCPNYNHNRSHITINYCPQCGEKFQTASIGSCNVSKHGTQRKERLHYCCDCGKDLKAETK